MAGIPVLLGGSSQLGRQMDWNVVSGWDGQCREPPPRPV
jgi:hypothetical protein